MPKIEGFYKLYEEKLEPFFDKEIRFLEIGVQDGSSISKWRSLSEKWNVWGLDIDSACVGKQIIIGSQEDKELMKQFEGFNIVVDDGGHTWKQQIETFKQLFPTMPEGSLYVIEDLHTSFWPKFQDYEISTIDYLKTLIDGISYKEVNQSDRLEGNRPVENPMKITHMDFYPSIVFIYK